MKTLLAVLVALVLPTTRARADVFDSLVVQWTIGEAAPIALLAGGAITQTSSKELGAIEIAIGGTDAAANLALGFLALDSDSVCSGCDRLAPLMFGLAAIDLATAIHGYVIVRHKERPVVIAPTVLRDRSTTLPGVAFGGSF